MAAKLAFWVTLDLLAAVVVILISIAIPQFVLRISGRWRSLLQPLTSRRWLSCLVIFLLIPALRLSILPLRPAPTPSIHDEFSYLLAGDTFAHGRLTNSTPAGWQHFQTFHVNLVPTYMSKYPPGQGMFLAVGELMGHPWIGVLLSCALAGATITWALQQWISSGWAFAGGIVFALRIGTLSYWANSYWGGAVACIGGALVLGAYANLRRHSSIRAAVLLGIGAGVLANSRPYEGLLVCIPFFVARAWEWMKRGHGNLVRREFLPLAMTLLIVFAWMGYYNWRNTGHPTKLPYVEWTKRYATVPLFSWQKPNPLPSYVDAQFEAFDKSEIAWSAKVHKAPLTYSLIATWTVFFFFLAPLLATPLAASPGKILFNDFKIPLIAFFICFGGLLLETWAPTFQSAHYMAPCTALFYLFVCGAMEVHSRKSPERPRRAAMAFSIVPAVLLLFIIAVVRAPESATFPSWATTSPQLMQSRVEVEKKLAALPGKDLVIVRYGPNHSPFQEFVYNSADLENASIVWARSLGDSSDRELDHEYPGRTLWEFDPDQQRLQPYLPTYRK